MWGLAINRMNHTGRFFTISPNNFKDELLKNYYYEYQMEYIFKLNKIGNMDPIFFAQISFSQFFKELQDT